LKQSITLFSAKDRITTGRDLVGLLFECAPDSEAYACANKVIPLVELIGDFDTTKQFAFDLAQKMLEGEPSFRGIQQLGTFEEVVIKTLQQAFHAIHLHNALEKLGISTCRISSLDRYLNDLQQITALRPTAYSLEILGPVKKDAGHLTSIRRAYARIRQGSFSSQGLKAEWRQVLSRIDPFWQRKTFLPGAKQNVNGAGGVWFYSTAYTYSLIGQLYEPYFPEEFHYLVENELTGGKALAEKGRKFSSLYDYVTREMRPSSEECTRTVEAIVEHLQSADLDDNEKLARELLLKSGFFQTFVCRHLPQGLFMAQLVDVFLEQQQPTAIVAGNPVFEGILLQRAQARSIPTLVLQHGILGDYCQFSDPPVDHYIVRGEFWREFLAAEPRKRACVLNPQQPKSFDGKTSDYGSRHILFLTAPYGLHPVMNEMDLDEILITLLATADEVSRPLVVRVHPMESAGFYEKRVSQLCQNNKLSSVDVSYSQGGDLSSILQKSAIAVTYCSTAFLDCLRHQVPIVSFDWHDFSYKKNLTQHGVFYFATSLQNLEELVHDGMQGNLAPYEQSLEPFLASTTDQQLQTSLIGLIQSTHNL